MRFIPRILRSELVLNRMVQGLSPSGERRTSFPTLDPVNSSVQGKQSCDVTASFVKGKGSRQLPCAVMFRDKANCSNKLGKSVILCQSGRGDVNICV